MAAAPKFDVHFFRKIITQKQAYWLGFIFADGCVIKRCYDNKNLHALRLALSSQDSGHVVQFLSDIGSSNSIFYCRGGQECRISLQSPVLVRDLEELGCVERKSNVLEFPSLKRSLLSHFIRGYFDGDGCVCYQNKTCRISIVGTEKFLTTLRNILVDHEVPFTNPRPRSTDRSWILAGNGNKKARAFYRYLYNGATRYLDRKKEKFSAIL
ncbi:MAG: hypothetical protein ACXAC5_00465 [Promethearchaeota archaeon]|jgi:hypothetical protein